MAGAGDGREAPRPAQERTGASAGSDEGRDGEARAAEDRQPAEAEAAPDKANSFSLFSWLRRDADGGHTEK